MIRRPPRSTRVRSSAASDVYKRQFTRYVLPHAKSAVINTISDVARGKSLGGAVQEHSAAMLENVGNSFLKRQSGKGFGSTNTGETNLFPSVGDSSLSMVCRKRRKRATPKSTSVKKPKIVRKKIQKRKAPKKKRVLSKRDIFS